MRLILNNINTETQVIDTVKIINPRQVYFYLTENVFPLWIEPGHDNKIVFVFEKKATLLLFKKWREKDTIWNK